MSTKTFKCLPYVTDSWYVLLESPIRLPTVPLFTAVNSTGAAIIGMLESESFRAAGVPDCEGNETTLTDCFRQPENSIPCHYVLVDCGTPLSDLESPDTDSEGENNQ